MVSFSEVTLMNKYIQNKKQHAGAKKLHKKCFCGKLRVHHERSEAIQCDKIINTETVGKIMDSKEIQDMRQQKI